MKNICVTVDSLLRYAVREGLLDPLDLVYTRNRLLELLKLDEYTEEPISEEPSLEEMLGALCDYAYEKGIIAENSVVYRDLFDTRVMGLLTPRPSEVIHKFNELYKDSPEKATDYFYHSARASDYIRTYRVSRDVRYSVPSEYGEIDISINLSKPEKDPKAIAAAKLPPRHHVSISS